VSDTSFTRNPMPASSRAQPIPAWRRRLIRVRAYFLKEVSEIRRQPLLILSLIVGPLLVLILFGANYISSTPHVRTMIVVPTNGLEGISEERIREVAGTNFTIVAVTPDRAAAEAALAAGEIDLIQVLPENVGAVLNQGVHPQIEFLSNVINPVNEGWIQYLAYAEINEVNKSILRSTTEQAQREVAVFRVRLVDVEDVAAEVEQGVDQARQAGVQEDIRETIDVLDALDRSLPVQEFLAATASDLAVARLRIATIRGHLITIEQAVADGTASQRLAELAETRRELRLLDSTLELFISTAPDEIVAPVSQSYANIRGSAYSAVIYYAPGVLALLVQHTAITLGALALVRERLMGAFEVFRVAPVSLSQMILGKYLGYTLFIALATLVLIIALTLIGVPLLGNPLLFAALILMLIVASLGVGFLISSLSSSDSQAIQLAMISLLLSIFFSGFFIGLDAFAWPALPVAYSIPMTHGLAGFQNLMLRGLSPNLWTWLGLGLIGLITFALVILITRRQMERV
jgi:ABC-2 type transport system permease protein